MKKTKRLILGVVASVAAFALSFTAFGCDFGGKKNDDKVVDSVIEGLVSGNENGSDVSEAKSPYSALQLSGSVKINEESSSKDSYGQTEDTSTKNSNTEASISAKLNIGDGIGDITLISDESSTENGETETEYDKMFVFLRGWDFYVGLSDSKEPVDYSTLKLSYKGNLFELLEEAIGGSNQLPMPDVSEMLSAATLAKAANDVVAYENYVILSLGKLTNSITVDGSVVTVQVNKVVYRATQDFDEVFKGITVDTTVGQILDNNTVKGYMSCYLNYFKPADVQKAVAGIIEGLPQEALLANPQLAAAVAAFARVEPDNNSTTYEYLVKLIKSDELNALVGALGAPLLKKIDELTVSDVAALATQKQIKQEDITNAYNAYHNAISKTTEQAFVIETSDSEGADPDENGWIHSSTSNNKISITGLSVIYKLSGKTIESQRVTANISTTSSYTSESGYDEDALNKYESSDLTSIELDIEMSFKAQPFANDEFAVVTLPEKD